MLNLAKAVANVEGLVGLPHVTGQHERAEEMARSALRLYGPDHPKLARLAFDIALLWSEQGRFQVALPVLRALLAVHQGSVERLLVLGALARVAGACGERETFELAWEEAWALATICPPPLRSAIPAVLTEVATGAASLREWQRASEAFRLAVRRAEEAGEYDVIARAQAGLASVEREERISPMQRPSARPAVQLSAAFVEVLESGLFRPSEHGGGEDR